MKEMMIRKRRIRNIAKYIPKEVTNFYIGVEITENTKIAAFEKLNLNQNDSFVPEGSFGRISEFNSEGKENVLKDLPMETYTVSRWWEWSKSNGQTFSELVYQDRQRYQREFIEPPEMDLQLIKHDNRFFYVSKKLTNTIENEAIIKHTINLFLEIFKECQVLREDFSYIPKQMPVKVKWEILPVGENMGERIADYVERRMQGSSNAEKKRTAFYYKYLVKANPHQVSIGINGFRGYVAYEYPIHKVCILENPDYGHATYILPMDWHDVSKLTKREILNNKFHIARIIHDQHWEKKIERYINIDRKNETSAKFLVP